jgi:hypothetical protein
LARLQNLESQARYASYMVRFVCYYLRVVEDETQEEEDSSRALSSCESNASRDELEDKGKSNSSVVPQRKPHRVKAADLIKDARELFPWKDD